VIVLDAEAVGLGILWQTGTDAEMCVLRDGASHLLRMT